MRGGSISAAVYRRLLRLYPRAFRDAVGNELEETFRDAHRAAVRRSPWRLVPLWLNTILDLARSVPAEWWPVDRRALRAAPPRKAESMDTLMQDIRYGFRTLVRSPGFTITALVTLALGIGANTAIFSLINQVLLRPLPVTEPDRLARLYTSDYSSGIYGTSSFPDFADFRENAASFEDIAAFAFPASVNVGTDDLAVRVTAQLVTGNYFNVLGLNAAQGRLFSPADDVSAGEQPVAVMSHALWQSRFGGDPDVIGGSISLNGSPFTVIGVAPERFSSLQVGMTPDLWVPLRMYSHVFPFLGSIRVMESRGGRWLHAVGRLRDGATLLQAQTEVTAIMARLAQEYPNSNLGTLAAPDAPRPVTLFDAGAAAIGPTTRDTAVNRARLLMAIVGSVLLIACANVANLLLARASRRSRETALRAAVGATRTRIVRQLLTESVLLGVVGGAAGLGLAVGLSRLLLPLGLPAALQATLDVPALALDFRVLGFTMAASLITGLLFGVFPAIHGSRQDLVPALKDGEGARGTEVRRKVYGVRDVLVIAQLAVSLVLLFTAGLFVRSTIAAYQTDLGFNPEHVALASMDISGQGLDQRAAHGFYAQLLERVRATPGVESAALAMVVPVDPTGSRTTVTPDGYVPNEGEDMEINFNVVSPGYFETLEIPIVRGRGFDQTDTEDGAPVVIVNQTFADRFWPGEDPIGKGIGANGQVIGVARDGKYRAVREDPLTYMYFPSTQSLQTNMTLAVRAADAAGMVTSIRAAVRDLQPGTPVYDGQLLRDHLADALAQERSTAVMVGVLGCLALILAAVGIYGVVTYAVTQRVQEFGIRTALGARAGDVVRLVMGRGARLAVAGVATGTLAAFALSSVVARFVFDISPTDPVTLIAVIVAMLIVVLIASFIPALRATRYDPIAALRSE